MISNPRGDVLLSPGELITVFSPDHVLQAGQVEFLEQQLLPSFETPERASMILTALEDHHLVTFSDRRDAVVDLGLAHDSAYIEALNEICRDLKSDAPAVLPSNWTGGHPKARAGHPIAVRLGAWSRDTYTSVRSGTFSAAAGSARSVVVALEALLERGRGCAFALSRPPHHHAGPNYMGGYCYFNGAAVAAMMCKRAGRRAAVIDVDFHHGNGTQDILYGSDILFCSLHGDPLSSFPYFTGFAEETGQGDGAGFNLNVPLPLGTDWASYDQALRHVSERVRNYGPDVVIISLGVDTFIGDPVGGFTFSTEDFARLGGALRGLAEPTLFLMEGGYAVEEIGGNVARTLTGFLS